MRLTTRHTARARGTSRSPGRGVLAAAAVSVLALGLAGPGLAGPATAAAKGTTKDGAVRLEVPERDTATAPLEASVEAAEKAAELQPVAVAVVEKADGSLKVETYETGTVAAAGRVVGELSKRDDVVAAQLDSTVFAMDVNPANDTYYSCQWALEASAACDFSGAKALGAPSAWARSTGSGVTVAVLDTGVDGTHGDLASRLVAGTDYVTSGTEGKVDASGHGTHVAGIIAAADNSLGTVGLAPDVKIMPVRVLNDEGSGYQSDVADGIIWAVDHGAKVINLSLGGLTESSAQTSAIQYALKKGALVVISAGNYAQQGNPKMWPAATPGALAVGAHNENGTVTKFSERRSYVAISAPGQDIASTCSNTATVISRFDLNNDGKKNDPKPCYGYETDQSQRYVFMNGTSMAAPFVSAAAALLLEKNPKLGPAALSAYLIGTATDAGDAGRDTSYGFGRLNVNKALDQVIAGTKRPTSIKLTPSSTRIKAGTTISLKATVWSSGYRLPYRKVSFQRLNLDGTWATLATKNTNANGDATYKIKPSRHTKYRVTAGAITGLASGKSATQTVAMYAKITRSGSSPSADRVTIKAQAYPKAKVKLKLQRKVGSTWKTISTKTTSSTGAVTFKKIKAPTGKRYFRVIGGKSSLAGDGKSSTLTLKVK